MKQKQKSVLKTGGGGGGREKKKKERKNPQNSILETGGKKTEFYTGNRTKTEFPKT